MISATQKIPWGPWTHLAFWGLLLAVFLQPFLSARRFGPAGDEYAHLPAGYSYWRTGEIELNPQHPPLVKLIAALPLLFLDLNYSEDDLSLGEWRFGRKFLFTNDADRILFWGRLGPILISVLLALFVYLWAAKLFGPASGLAALAMYGFMPVIIGHAQFVATDVGLAAFSFITLYWLWRFFREEKQKYLITPGLFLGLTLGTKFSALVLLPVVLVLFLVGGKAARGSWRQVLKSLTIIGALAIAVTYFIYLFPTDLLYYWHGYQSLYQDRNLNFQFYLNGNFNPNGWWYYFPFAFLLKTPLAFVILMLLVFAFWRRLKVDPVSRGFVILPPAAFFLASMWGAYNIGVRYIMPVYPFLIVLASGLIALDWPKLKQKRLTAIVWLLVGWQAVSTLLIFPHYLAYFSELIGGPANGYKYLDDSNISWGQDVKLLAEYQSRHPETKVVYKWYQSALDYYGLNNNLAEPTVELWSNPPPARYAVDINYLIRAKYVSLKDNRPELDWLARYEPVDRIGYGFLVYEVK